jgi:pyruvate dehydrogenase E1 component subunit alpha
MEHQCSIGTSGHDSPRPACRSKICRLAGQGNSLSTGRSDTMPREAINLPYQVDYLSILDEKGNLDEALEPDLADDLLLRLHRTMLLARRLDERMLRLQRQGRLGTFAPVKGQEAAQIGAVAALRPSDWMVPSFRESAAGLWRGQTIESLLLTYGGFYQGNTVADAGHNFPMAVPVGTQLLHAVGLGYAIAYRQQDEVVIVFFGDGATSEGDFAEALNFAGVWQTPVVFLCQNNGWAISLPRAGQTRTQTLAQKALAFGLPGIQVDGNDVLAVYSAVQEAVERARSGNGPTLIECVTYRLAVHTTADDPSKYRSDEEVAAWETREPLPRFQAYLKGKQLLSDAALESLEAEIEAELREAVQRVEQQQEQLAGEALSLFDHIYADMPAYLQEQRQELDMMLAAGQGSKEASNGEASNS